MYKKQYIRQNKIQHVLILSIAKLVGLLKAARKFQFMYYKNKTNI
jgi:hypothetical protein